MLKRLALVTAVAASSLVFSGTIFAHSAHAGSSTVHTNVVRGDVNPPGYTNWVGTTTYAHFACHTPSESSNTDFYVGPPSGIKPGQVPVPGDSAEIVTPTEDILQCTFYTGEQPDTRLLEFGSTDCKTISGPASFYVQSEDTNGNILLRCYAYLTPGNLSFFSKH